MSSRRSPLAPTDELNLAPLRASHESDPLESELKALFIGMFDLFVRPGKSATRTLSTPQLGPYDQFERAVKADGLALRHGSNEEAMRYIYRAWRAGNPKRGTHMLRTYLQLMWPNAWTLEQMWAAKNQPYPTVLEPQDGGDHYLTSRLNVLISSGTSDGSDVAELAPALRSVLPARMTLNVSIRSQGEMRLPVAAGYYAGAQVQHFTGEFTRPPESLAVAIATYQGASIEHFNGNFA